MAGTSWPGLEAARLGMLVGVNIATSAAPGADPAGDAAWAEELGFDFVSSSDHPSGAAPTFETWTMLTWIAARTSRIRIATRVLGTPYRPPAMVAKMAETLDRLSGGRLILGLGSGHSDEEFRAFGLGVPTPRQKVDGLRDAIQIMRGLWSQPRFSYRGPVHHTEAAPMEPKAQRHIPIWLGTYGPRALAVTGELADGWIPSFGSAGPEEIPRLRARLEAAATAAGRAPGEITYAYNVPVRVEPGAEPQPGVVSRRAAGAGEPRSARHPAIGRAARAGLPGRGPSALAGEQFVPGAENPGE